jgi:hypothetical protein
MLLCKKLGHVLYAWEISVGAEYHEILSRKQGIKELCYIYLFHKLAL